MAEQVPDSVRLHQRHPAERTLQAAGVAEVLEAPLRKNTENLMNLSSGSPIGIRLR